MNLSDGLWATHYTTSWTRNYQIAQTYTETIAAIWPTHWHFLVHPVAVAYSKFKEEGWRSKPF